MWRNVRWCLLVLLYLTSVFASNSNNNNNNNVNNAQMKRMNLRSLSRMAQENGGKLDVIVSLDRELLQKRKCATFMLIYSLTQMGL